MPRRANTESTAEVQLLTAKLEASNAKLEVQHLRTEVKRLEAVILQCQQEHKEAHRLLLKQLPRRPFTNSTEKSLLAASQGWKCAGPYEDCPLKLVNGGVFDQSLYIVEHLEPWSRSARHVGNRACYCPYCAARKTREEYAARKHRPPSESGGDSDGEDEE